MTKPHRNLGLTAPYARGEDVKALQLAVNERLRARGRKPIKVDGVYGRTTQHAVRRALWFLGAPSQSLDDGATMRFQRILRNPESRPGSWLPIAKDRNAYLARQDHEAEAFCKWAEGKVGTHERPLNSNRGSEIDLWQRECGLLAQPYCGMFLVFGLRRVCGIAVPASWCYTPNILNDARAGKWGCHFISPAKKPQPGDIVLMDFRAGGDPVMHVGVYVGGGRIVEANTSADDAGSQDNGGGVYVKRLARRKPFIVGYVRPPYGK